MAPVELELTSSTFTRVRLFTDIEDITLDKWLDAENAGQDDLAKKILDAGLLVEHMIAEIPLEQNLADSTELKELTENADRVFGLVVCFGCNRAFQSKDDQTSVCPNCGAKLSRAELTPTNLSNNKKPALKQPENQSSPNPQPVSPKLQSNKKKHVRLSRKESNSEKQNSGQSSSQKDKKAKAGSHPRPPAGPAEDTEDEDSANDGEDEGWFGSSTNPGAAHAGKHGVKPH